MADTPRPVKAWGMINYAGDLMPMAFMFKKQAERNLFSRWRFDAGQSRVIPVLITPIGEDHD